MIKGMKWHLESNPTSASDAWRAQAKPCVHQDPEAPQRLSQICFWVFECLLYRHRSAVACCRDRGSGWSRPGRHNMWHNTSWKKLHYPHHEATKQTSHKLEKIYTKEVQHCYKSSRTHNRFPNLIIQQRDWETPKNLTLEASGIW